MALLNNICKPRNYKEIIVQNQDLVCKQRWAPLIGINYHFKI